MYHYKDKQCARCSNTFSPVNARQTYCSPECKQPKSTCIQCGIIFSVIPNASGSFCSRKCYNKNKTRPELQQKPCEYCNVPFKPKYPEARFCSVKCLCRKNNEGKRRKLKTCIVCGASFDSKHTNAYMCSRKCRGEHRRKTRAAGCLRCGGPIPFVSGNTLIKYCSQECRAEPVGSTRKNQYGYVSVKIPKDDPLGTTIKRWELQHRYVVAKSIGRPLRSDEHVHHINGIRDDNRLENLELWCKPGTERQVPGQRVSDLINYVIENYQTDLIEELRKRRIIPH
jgi:hypothetical protein